MLFRLGPTKGTLKIDGVDINKLRLKDLRNAMSYIPQVGETTYQRNIPFSYKVFRGYRDEAFG